MKQLDKIIKNGKATVEEVFAEFDKLEAIDLDFLTGQWIGKEISTQHPLDGVLDISGWYGKKFEDKDHVHPLVMYTHDKKSLYACNPTCLTFNRMIPIELLAPILPITCLSNRTLQSSARIRMMEYRGVVTATMVYDEQPIHDVFRKIDENNILGVMDLKPMPEPYFFVLTRDDKTSLTWIK